MALLVICLFAVLALGQIALYVRLSPLQTLQDERTARQQTQGSSRDAEATEGAALLAGLRTLHKESAEIVRRERGGWEVLRVQLNAERNASEALRIGLNTERLALAETIYRELAPLRVDHAAGTLKISRPTQRAAHAGRGNEEKTKHERLTTLPDVAAYSQVVAASRAGGAAEESDNEKTSLWEKADLKAALTGAEAGGAHLPPQSAPHAVRSGVVAPPASAPPPLPAEPGIVAAGLGQRPHSARVAQPPAPPRRTATLAGMHATPPQAPVDDTRSERSSWPTLRHGGVGLSTHAPAGSAPAGDDPRFSKTLLFLPAQREAPTSSPSTSAASFVEDEDDEKREPTRDTELILPQPAPKPGHNNGEATGRIDPEPPRYARRPPVHEGLRGLGGVPEAAPGRRLRPDEATPRRSLRVEQEAGK